MSKTVFRIGSSKPISKEEQDQIEEFLSKKETIKLDYMVETDVPDFSMRNALKRQYGAYKKGRQ